MPEDDRRVVVNTTPIITLSLIDHLPLLRDLYRQVVIPVAVQKEVLSGGPQRAGVAQLAAADWIKIQALRDPRHADHFPDLDRGEAEVIALAQEVSGDLVILDERQARRHARRLSLPLTGTLGVLLKAKSRGLIPEVAPLIATIRAQGIRLGEALVTRVLELAKE
jgi:uncharacterized protein